MSPDGELRLRRATRALVVDPEHRILLVRFEFTVGTVWAPPGGGIEPGEHHLDALRRELLEEIGLADPDIGPLLWRLTRVFPLSDHWDGQVDDVYLVRVPAHDAAPTLTWEQMRAEHVHELRWWTIDDLLTADVRFTPEELPAIVATLAAEGPPAEPLVLHRDSGGRRA